MVDGRNGEERRKEAWWFKRQAIDEMIKVKQLDGGETLALND